MKYLKYAIGEIILVVLGIMIAISMNNQKEINRNKQYENKILKEIRHGLNQDLIDLNHNYSGHEFGLKACSFWRSVVFQKQINVDSTRFYYQAFTRDYISIQNTAGYEALKSKGLELIKDDSLRTLITILYEQDFNSMMNLEENYFETQFQENYFLAFNNIVSPYFIFDDVGNIIGMEQTMNLSHKNRNALLTYIWKIDYNRRFVIASYQVTIEKVNAVLKKIDEQISQYEK